MIWRHPVSVSLGIIISHNTIDLIFPAWKCHSVSGIINPCSRYCPFLRNFIDPYQGNIVRSVLLCRIVFIVIDPVNFLFTPRESITYPSIKFPVFFLQEKLNAICPSISKKQLRFRIFIKGYLCSVFIIYLILQILEIYFSREFIDIFLKVPEITKRHLVSNFRFHIVTAWNPWICRIAGCWIGKQVKVLGIPCIRCFYRAPVRNNIINRDTWLRAKICL